MRRALVFLVLFAGCGGSPPPLPARPAPPPVATSSAGKPVPRDVLSRRDVVAHLDQGFGRFLQQVAVEPSLEAGRFRGWMILELRPAEFWQRVDLQPGDVVKSVNGLPLEREIEAWEAFESLRTADELSVAYQRGGAERSFRYRIVD